MGSPRTGKAPAGVVLEEGRWFFKGASSGPFVSGPKGKACFGPPLLSHGGEDERPKSDPGSDQERPKSRRSEAQRRFWPRRRALPAFRKYVTGTQSKRETAIYNVYMNVHICSLFVHICTYLYTIGTHSEHMAVSHLLALLKKAYQHTFGTPRGEPIGTIVGH